MNRWKVIALIFIFLFALLLMINIMSVTYVINEDKNIKECYYDICSDYPDAGYENDVCYCYEYDFMGEIVIAETQIMD